MLTEKEISKIIVDRVKEIFGEEYLRANRDKACTAYGLSGENEYMYFIALKSKSDLPQKKASPKGWTVFADIRVDRTTGKVIKEDFQTE